MDFKYYREAPVSHHIWFKLIDSDGKLVEDFPDQPCFGEIVHGFEEKADLVQVYQQKHLVPYCREDIKRWINDVNEMGFPCFFEEEEDPVLAGIKEYICGTVNEGVEDMTLMMLRHGKPLPLSHHNFFVNTHDYEDKNHFFSALSLVRCLIQSGINKVPEEYFKLMDEDPKRDKLEACQDAHRIVTRKDKPYDPKMYAPDDHMVTYDGNGKNIAKDALMKRFAERKTNLRDKGYLRIHANWNSANDKGWRGKGYYD